MTSVVLIRPLCAEGEPEFAEPLGIERIAGYLRAHGRFRVLLYDRRLYAQERKAGMVAEAAPTFFESLRAEFADGDAPDIVGYSLMTASDVPDVRRMHSRLRHWWPQARFVAGGVFVTSAPENAASLLPAGVLLLPGEGEAAFPQLVGGCPEQMPCCGLEAPDGWAMAYRPHLVRYAALGCAVNLQSSRGCPGSCTFCATPLLPERLRRWQPRSISLVADEMEHEARRLQAAGLPPVFNFVDDDFGPLARVEELAEEIGRRGLRVAFSLEMRLASLVGQPGLAERLRGLRERGLTRIFFGLESLHADTLRRWRKPDVLAGLPEVVDAFRVSGVEMQAGYILWHAGQTPEGALQEVVRLHDLGIYTHRMGISRLIAFPGCALGGQDASDGGFQRLQQSAAVMHGRFTRDTAELTGRWTVLAIQEPYAAACAHLTGDSARLDAIRSVLGELNERSYATFLQVAAAFRPKTQH